MAGASCLLVLGLAIGFPTAEDPASLVERLGAARYADREAAAKSLEGLGAAAIPALRAARDARDLEIRTRSAALLHKIEGMVLTQPTMVNLAFDERTIEQVVQTLSEQSGMKIMLLPQNIPTWKAQRVSLKQAHPVTFWQAVEELCAVAGLQNNMELRGFSPRNDPALTLTNRGARPVYPMSEQGPLLVYLTGLEYQRHVTFAPVAALPAGRLGQPPAVPRERTPLVPRAVTTTQCSVQLRVLAEPRLGLRQSGALRIVEAHDERGNSLVPDYQATPNAVSSVMMGGAFNSVLNLRSPLNHPDTPGERIQLLRGTVPLQVISRQPDPLVVSLSSAPGTTVENGETRLTLHEVRQEQNRRQRQVEFSIREGRGGGIPATDEPTLTTMMHRANTLQQSIEILDARGGSLPWFQPGGDPQSSRITLTIAGMAGAEPKELRFYRLTEASLDLTFEFRNIVMP